MKILHLIQKPQNRGAETFACQLANHQFKQGHEVKLVSIFSGEAELPWKGEISSLQASLKSRFLDFPAWKRLNRIVSEFQPDVIQTNAGDTLKYAVFSKLIFRWKVPVVFRNASEVGRYLNSKFQKQFNRFLYKHVDGVISVSQASKKDLVTHFPFLQSRSQVIPIGLEEKSYIKAIDFRSKGNHHVVHVGGFSFEKNHEGLINIFQKVLPTVSGAHLHLVGDGPLRSRIEDLVRAMNLEDRVTFYGFVNNPLDFIKSADVLVLPSIIEGLPGVLLEAMYCKTPVVAYDVGGISEIVSDRTGFLVEKDDEDSFSKRIEQNLLNPDLARIESAYAQVCSHYMNKEISRKFSEAYQRIIAKQRLIRRSS